MHISSAPTLSVCSGSMSYTGGSSCCTSGMETQFLISSEESLREKLRKLNLQLHDRITSAHDRYMGEFITSQLLHPCGLLMSLTYGTNSLNILRTTQLFVFYAQWYCKLCVSASERCLYCA